MPTNIAYSTLRKKWPRHPKILEVSAWPWLSSLSSKYGYQVTLANIPKSEFEEEIGRFDMVWLMGVWERSPRGRDLALNHPGLREEYRRVLHDFHDEDVVGSPYSVHRYRVDPRLGGPKGLAAARAQLAERGLGLLLDFVPNHLAVDHDWVTDHPSFFIKAAKEEQQARPNEFFRAGDELIAHGRDPYFPPWTDTAQINAFSQEARRALGSTLMDIAKQCDGVRCDMAMLVTNEVFSRTWGKITGPPPAEDFWQELIPHVRDRFPSFIFIAEVYWDMEWELQQQGFDFCYDKRLYDRMAHENADEVRAHLTADLDYQEKLIRFIENHDENRAAVVFAERALAAGVLALTLPGAKLVHEGQTRGHRNHLPVQLGRRPSEQTDEKTADFYKRLMEIVSSRDLCEGTWRLSELQTEIPIEQQRQLVSYTWALTDTMTVVIINFGAHPVQGRVRIKGLSFPPGRYRCTDRLQDVSHSLLGKELEKEGIPLKLTPWSAHIYCIQRD